MLDDALQTDIQTRPQELATAYARCQAPSGSRWYVVATLPKAERRAHATLHMRGFKVYLPLITVRWRDRTCHTGPLFPGYLFVRLDLSRPWHPVRYAPGVFNLINIDGIPTPCPEAAISALQAGEALRATPIPAGASMAPGMPCSVRAGVFRGADAVVVSVGAELAVVSLLMLGALRTVSVPAAWLGARDE